MVQNKKVEAGEHGIEIVGGLTTPLDPLLSAMVCWLLAGPRAVAQAHHHCALVQELAAERLAQGATNPGDADA